MRRLDTSFLFYITQSRILNLNLNLNLHLNLNLSLNFQTPNSPSSFPFS